MLFARAETPRDLFSTEKYVPYVSFPPLPPPPPRVLPGLIFLARNPASFSPAEDFFLPPHPRCFSTQIGTYFSPLHEPTKRTFSFFFFPPAFFWVLLCSNPPGPTNTTQPPPPSFVPALASPNQAPFPPPFSRNEPSRFFSPPLSRCQARNGTPPFFFSFPRTTLQAKFYFAMRAHFSSFFRKVTAISRPALAGCLFFPSSATF